MPALTNRKSCTSWSHYTSSHLGHSMSPSPLPCRLNRSGLIVLPPLGNIVVKGIIGVGGAEQGLDRQEDRADLEGWGPVVCTKVRMLYDN